MRKRKIGPEIPVFFNFKSRFGGFPMVILSIRQKLTAFQIIWKRKDFYEFLQFFRCEKGLTWAGHRKENATCFQKAHTTQSKLWFYPLRFRSYYYQCLRFKSWNEKIGRIESSGKMTLTFGKHVESAGGKLHSVVVVVVVESRPRHSLSVEIAGVEIDCTSQETSPSVGISTLMLVNDCSSTSCDRWRSDSSISRGQLH